MSDELTIPASVPGMAEAAEAVLGFDAWSACDDCGADLWWKAANKPTGYELAEMTPVVPLSLPAGRLVALEWLRERSPIVWWLPQLRWALGPSGGSAPLADARYRSWQANVLEHARAEGWRG